MRLIGLISRGRYWSEVGCIVCAVLFGATAWMTVRSFRHIDFLDICVSSHSQEFQHFITLSSVEHVFGVSYRTMWKGRPPHGGRGHWTWLTYASQSPGNAWKNGITENTVGGTEHHIAYRFLGFGLESFVNEIPTGDFEKPTLLVLLSERSLAVPQWFVLPTTAILFVILLRRLLRRRSRRRQEAGLCLTCGYDLRGNVSGQCPECGTATSVEGELNAETRRRREELQGI